MKKALFVVVIFMLMTAFTTALLGVPRPTFEQALTKLSSVNIEYEPLLDAIQDYENLKIEPTSNAIENFFIEIWNIITPIVNFFLVVTEFISASLEQFWQIIKVTFYLFFGVNIA